MLAMRRAVEALATVPTLALIDGNRCPVMPIRCMADHRWRRQGATRFRPPRSWPRPRATPRWCTCTRPYPEYCFDQHKGYGTALHLERLHQHGASPVHRRSFAPGARNADSAPVWRHMEVAA